MARMRPVLPEPANEPEVPDQAQGAPMPAVDVEVEPDIDLAAPNANAQVAKKGSDTLPVMD